jgi:signal transduction histidine kinase/ActR/RegA family two-component response regulator
MAIEAAGNVLILAPSGRDAAVVASMLAGAGVAAEIVADLAAVADKAHAAGGLVVSEEAFRKLDRLKLTEWIKAQPPWSDFPIILLRARGDEETPQVQGLMAELGNVTVLERPLHPMTLIASARSAARARGRQRDAEHAAEFLERAVEDRTFELAAANRQLLAQIDERERVEAALRQAQRLEAVGQLTSGVAHDFNNLLTVILGSLQFLERDETDPKTIRRLDLMRAAAERGAKLTAQLLAFSRRQRLEPKPVDLNDTVASMRDLLQSTMGGSVRLETVLLPGLWPALVDPTQIELIILNLAINARDAMEVGGGLTVETANAVLSGAPRRPEEPPPGDYVAVTVSDTGSGMSDEVLARVFEPFFTTKPVGKGSGLGLSQVLGFAQQSGGGVRIDTRPGEGTSVRVYLPRASAAAAAEPLPSLRRTIRTAGGKAGVILLLDDDSAVREVTRALLDEAGYEVIEAGSGGAALEILDRGQAVDLMMVDFAMPGMNGVEVARAAHARRPSLPLLFVTGHADLSALKEVGEERIVQKPFRQDDLRQKIERALGRSSDDGNVVSLDAARPRPS